MTVDMPWCGELCHGRLETPFRNWLPAGVVVTFNDLKATSEDWSSIADDLANSLQDDTGDKMIAAWEDWWESRP